MLAINSADNSYDLVFNQAVLEYFCAEDERKLALKEMFRVTKPGGKIAIIVQHTGHSFGKFWKLLGWPGYSNQPDVIKITPRILEKELMQAGFSQIRIDGIYPWKALFFWPPWYKRWKLTHKGVYLLGQFLARFVPLPILLRRHLSTQILAIGTKL